MLDSNEETNMFLKDTIEAELVKQFIENKHRHLNVRVIKGAPVSKECYITFNNKVLTEVRLEKELRIRRKELETLLRP